MVISNGVPNSITAEEEDPRRRGRFSKTVQSELKRQVRYWYSLARTAESEGDLSAAEALYRKCIDLDEKDGHSWLALAQMHSRRDPGEARKAFAAALLKCPRNVHLLQAFGVFEHRMGNLDSARKLFHDALAIEPANPYVCQAWGLLEQRNGETDVARDIYRKCTERRPQSEVCAAWATLEFGDGNARKARELFKLGLRSVKRGLKSRVSYLNSWAEAEERSGNLAQARSLLGEALQGLPTAETRIKLAKLEARAGSLMKGLDLMKGVDSEAESLSANAYNGWAFLEMQAANTGRTRELLKEGNAKFPMDGALLQTWGTLEEKCCEYETARELYSKSVEVRPTAVALVAWACMEAKLGDTARARELFRNALRVDPLHGAAYHAYASLEMKQGNVDEARRIFELGLDKDPSASVLVGYAQLEMKFGSRKDKARELFRRGVSQTRGDASFIWHAWLTMELRERDPLSARGIALEARKRYSGNSRVSRFVPDTISIHIILFRLSSESSARYPVHLLTNSCAYLSRSLSLVLWQRQCLQGVCLQTLTRAGNSSKRPCLLTRFMLMHGRHGVCTSFETAMRPLHAGSFRRASTNAPLMDLCGRLAECLRSKMGISTKPRKCFATGFLSARTMFPSIKLGPVWRSGEAALTRPENFSNRL